VITLTEFLLARIAEDRAGALLARDGDDWHISGECNVCDQTYVARAEYGNPSRVLAECEAKRQIVKRHTPVRTARAIAEKTDYASCPICDPYPPMEAPDPGSCDTVRLLALPYANHKDYRSEWKPS
jgi:hypothetical protein